MIELQRARMLQNSKGPRANHSPAAAAGRNVPQQTAVSSLQTEDRQMQRFLNRMQRRDDGQQLIADATSGPTVPTALSRRLLHRQGVGYLDETVAAIASASADRFLATVLHQAGACRDQRLEGAGMARKARRYRKRHVEQCQADTDDRRRRKKKNELQREKSNLAAIAAADVVKKGGNAGSKKDSDGVTKSKKKKKTAAPAEAPENSSKAISALKDPDEADEEESHDSVDDEEDFYQNYYYGAGESDDSDEDDETLKLVDITRPLEAWDFHLTGKLGLESTQAESEAEESEEDKDDDEKSEDNRADDGDTNKAPLPDKDDNAKSAEDAAPPGSPKRPPNVAAPKAAATPSQTQS